MPIYMSLAGYPGDVTATGYAGWIELSSFSWGLARPATSNVSFQDFQVSCNLGISSTKLMLASAKGLHIATGIIVGVTVFADKPFEHLRYTLADCLITSYQQSLSGGEDTPPYLNMSIAFAKVTHKIAYKKADGSTITQTNFWDLKTNTGG
jgi:type VI secretion system secreted protein Hcp